MIPAFFVLLRQLFIYGCVSGSGMLKVDMYNKKAAANFAAAFVFFKIGLKIFVPDRPPQQPGTCQHR